MPVKVVSREFVTSAAGAAGLPGDPLPHVAMVGRSNVGKSSLVNALVGQKLARTSGTPGKTRLLNVYRVGLTGYAMPRALASGPDGSSRFRGMLYLVDLPGYGFAPGGADTARAFERLTREYFDSFIDTVEVADRGVRPFLAGVLLAVDARHPGLASDLEAHDWLGTRGVPRLVVVTKIDRLKRTARERAVRAHEAALRSPVLPISATTGEGLQHLWSSIVALAQRPLTST